MKKTEEKNQLNPEMPALSYIENVRYLVGNPRNWAFDASSGIFKYPDGKALTSPGESIQLIPIGLSISEGQQFGMTKQDGEPDVRKWAQLFFISNNGAVCCLVFHGFSVEEFERFYGQSLFYDGLEITEVILEIKPREVKTARGNVIWILNFENVGKIDFDPESPSGLFRQDMIGKGEKQILSVGGYAYPGIEGPK